MPACVVPYCHNYEQARLAGVPFHSFPKETRLARTWLKAIRSKKLPPNVEMKKLAHARVCGKHFKEEDYLPDPKHAVAPHLYARNYKLKPGTVPSVFEFSPKKKPRSESVIRKREKARFMQLLKIRFKQPTTSRQRETATPDSPVVEDTGDTSEKHNAFEETETSTTSKLVLHSEETDKAYPLNLVCESQVLQLFRRCQLCGSVMDKVKPQHKKARLTVHWKCSAGHEGTWKGSPELI